MNLFQQYNLILQYNDINISFNIFDIFIIFEHNKFNVCIYNNNSNKYH